MLDPDISFPGIIIQSCYLIQKDLYFLCSTLVVYFMVRLLEVT